MHVLGARAGAQRRERRGLARDRDLVDFRLAPIADLADPESAVEAELEAVKIGHAAKTQEHRLAAAHDAGRRAVVGARDLRARRHDLQEMRVRRHRAVRVMTREQLGGLARAGLGGRERDLVLGHAVADRVPPRLHHRRGDLAGVARELQFLVRLDHAQVGDDRRDIGKRLAAGLFVDVGPDQRRHQPSLDRDPARGAERRRQVFAPLVAEAVVPRFDAVDAGVVARAVVIDRRRDQQRRAVAPDEQQRRAAELHVQVVVVAGEIVDRIVVGDQREVDPRVAHALGERVDSAFEHRAWPAGPGVEMQGRL